MMQKLRRTLLRSVHYSPARTQVEHLASKHLFMLQTYIPFNPGVYLWNLMDE
jgi:hypothetical protein